jgi:hypothetical protein
MPTKKSSTPAKAGSVPSTSNNQPATGATPPRKRRSKPLELKIWGTLFNRGIMTIEEIEQVALKCYPVPSRQTLRATLKELEEKQWIREYEGVYTTEKTIRTPSLKLEANYEIETALKVVGKRFCNTAQSLNTIALTVLMVALQHPHELKEWFGNMAYYCYSEGLNQIHFLCQDAESKCKAFDREMDNQSAE